MEITKDMLIGEIIRKKPEAIEILMRFGMGCVGCPSSQMESLEEAAMVHGLNLDALMTELNK
jgi:hybrid cluster-associated redox disulfide protein